MSQTNRGAAPPSAFSQQAAGPALAGAPDQVVAVLPNPAALEDAVARLTLLGVDRADMTLPPTTDTAPLDAGTPTTEVDSRQVRTLASSATAAGAALAAAGVTIATGGAAALAAVAAAAIGSGAGAAVYASQRAGEDATIQEREERAREGRLILTVRLKQTGQMNAVVDGLREAGAIDVRHSGAAA